MKSPCVYLLASHYHGTLYVGVTSDLVTRVWHHRTGAIPGFTRQYGVRSLVWFEQHPGMREAIEREKAIKHWRREWKIALFKRNNPEWRDLYPRICRLGDAPSYVP